MNDPLIGQKINRYKIVSMLGGGGMGTVYLGRDTTLQRDVAIKIMHPQYSRQQVFQERFLQEARAAARFDYPGIVKVYDFGEFNGQLYIVLEFIAGVSLGKRLQELRAKKQWLSVEEAVELMRQVCLSVDYLHQRGAIHRDLKPDNILLRPEPSGSLPYRPVLADLGLAKLADGSVLTQDGTSMGTPAYMSPEQALGEKTDARSDVYELGIMLFEVVVGQLPFPAQTLTQAIQYHTNAQPPRPASLRKGVSPVLQAVILKAIEKNPASRYQTAGALAAALPPSPSSGVATQVDTNPVVAPPPTGPIPADQKTRVQTSPPDPRGPSILGEFSTPSEPGQKGIQILAVNGTTRVVPFKSETITIGRDSTCEVVLDDPKVSRKHTQVTFNGKFCSLIDLGSANGTYMDNQRLLPGVSEAWPPDKALRVGDTWLRLVGLKDDPLTIGGVVSRQPVDRGSTYASSTPSSNSGSGAGPMASRPGSIGLVVENQKYTLDPGSSVMIPMTLLNQGTLVDHFSISAQGIPQDWVSGLPPEVQLMPGAQSTVRLTVQAPRSSQARAGAYPITLRAQSIDTPGQAAQTQTSLVITPFVQFSAKLQPEKVRSGRPAKLVITNKGNQPETFIAQWQDRGDEVSFTPPTAQIQVPEGASIATDFSANPRSRQLMGNEKSLPFTVQVVSSKGDPQTVAGEVVSKAILPVWLIPLLTLLLLCGVATAVGAVAYGGKLFGAKAQMTQTPLAIATVPVVIGNNPTPTPLPPSQSTPTASTGDNPAQATDTPMPTQNAATAAVDKATPTSTTQPLVVLFAHPTDTEFQPAAIKNLTFEVTANDPAVGQNNGDGIKQVDMQVLNDQGIIFQKTEQNVHYCAFGDNDQGCIPLAFYGNGNRWPNGNKVDNGTYTLKAVVQAKDGRTASVETKVQINLLPWVAFVSIQNGNQEIMVTNLDGSVQVPLTNEPTRHHTDPVYSLKAGRLLMVAASTDGYDITNKNDIYTMNTDGSDVKKVTTNSVSHLYPSWSPDGKHILYTSNDLGKRDVYVMDADGKNVKNLTPNMTNVATNSPAYNTQAAWSPNGKLIAFRSDATGKEEIYVMDTDGSNLIQLSNLQSSLFDPVWSPDSKHIMFYSDAPGAQGIYTVDPDGSNLVNISNNSPDNQPAWSPSGNEVVCVTYDSSGTVQYLVIMSADGSNRRTLAQSKTIGQPAFSPEGNRIIYEFGDGTNPISLFVVNKDGSNPVKLASQVGSYPTWVP